MDAELVAPAGVPGTTAVTVLAAHATGDTWTGQDRAGERTRRLRRLLTDDPGAADRLWRVLDGLGPALPGGAQVWTKVTVTAKEFGQARVHQVGHGVQQLIEP